HPKGNALRSGEIRDRLFVDGRTVRHSFFVDGLSGLQLFALKLEPRSADASRTTAGLLLHPLDELYELRHGVQTQQRKEPAIELECLLCLALSREVIEFDGLRRVRVDEAGDPADGASADGFDDDIVNAHAEAQAVAENLADRRNAPNVSAGLLYRFKVRMFRGKLRDMLGLKVRLVGDGIVIEHAR